MFDLRAQEAPQEESPQEALEASQETLAGEIPEDVPEDIPRYVPELMHLGSGVPYRVRCKDCYEEEAVKNVTEENKWARTHLCDPLLPIA